MKFSVICYLIMLLALMPCRSHATVSVTCSPQNGDVIVGPYNVVASASSPSNILDMKVHVYINGQHVVQKSCFGPWTTCTADFQKSFNMLYESPDGQYNMNVYVEYVNGVIGECNSTFSVNRVPVVSISSPIGTVGAEYWITGEGQFSATQNQTYGSMRTLIDGVYVQDSYRDCTSQTCNYSHKINGSAYGSGIHTLTLEATSAGRTVAASKQIKQEIIQKTDFFDTFGETKACSELSGNSTFNVGTGNVSHDQTLFKIGKSPLSLDFVIYYNSKDTINSTKDTTYRQPMGQGWSHTYDISLFSNPDNTKVLRGGGLAKRFYTWTAEGYISQPGDSSKLIVTNDGYEINHRNGMKYNFDSTGRLVSILDRFGNRTSVSAKTNGLQTITDPAGRTMTLTYDVDGEKIVTITDPDLQIYNLTYDCSATAVAGLLTKVEYPAPTLGAPRPTWQYDYNNMRLLQYKTDPEQNIVKYEYDFNGVLTKSINPEGVIDKTGNENPAGHSRSINITAGATTYTFENGGSASYTYDLAYSQILSKADPLGNRITYTYNTNGYVATKTEPVDSFTSFTTSYLYDAYGNVTEMTGYSTHYQYDSGGNIISSTTDTPILHMAYEYDYENYDQIKKVTNLLESPNTITTYAYDTDGEGYLRVTVTDPSSYLTVTRMYSNGNILDEAYPNGQKLAYAYDSNGILQSVTNASGVKLLFENYNKKGNPGTAKIVDANQVIRQTTTLEYDALGRKTKNTVAGALTSYITQYGYDKKGNVVSVTDAETNTTSMAYTFRNQVKSQTNPLSQTTTIEHGTTCSFCGGVDKVTAVIDANQHKTGFEYDLASNLKKETDASGKSVSYEYYPSGLVSKKLDGAGNTLISYTYDGLGRLTRRDYNDADHTWDAFTYGANGMVATAANQNISYTYEYYPNDWLKKATDSLGRVISYDEYNGAGQRKKVTVQPGTSDQKVLNYDYDTKGRLSTITSAAGTFTFGYDELGRRSTLTYPNGIAVSYTFHQDQPAWLTEVKYQGTSATLLDVAYTAFDKVGNRKTKVQDSVTSNFAYDLVYRLLTVTAPTSETYQYDAVGNMTVGPLSTQTRYLYDAANQQTSNLTWVATYDDFGNLKTAGVWTYGWNPAGQLIKSTGDVREVTYKYDPFGRRIERNWREYNSYNYVYTYLYDGDDVVMSWKKDANTGSTLETNHYVHAPGVDEHLGMVPGTTPYFYLADGNNNILKVVKQDQSIAQTYTYDSYGVYTNGLTLDQPYQMAGRELDRDTYLYYNRARYYSPRSKRFISRDPIGFAGGDALLYGYTSQNPINFIDPLGLDQVAVNYYEGGTGHIGLSVNGGPSYGYYGRGQSAFGFLSGRNGAGAEQEDFVTQGDPARVVIINIAPGQAKIVQDGIDRLKKPGKYNLYTNNCAKTAERILEEAGIPNIPSTILPSRLIEGLKRKGY